MKDHFSTESEKYAQFRPHYPSEFFGYLNEITSHKEIAWDCGTGNGQVAFELARSFDKGIILVLAKSFGEIRHLVDSQSL